MKTKNDWCFRFFNNPDYLKIYSDMTGPERTKQELDFCKKFLGWKKGEPILDAPCGAGRHSLHIAQLGYTVTGVDFSWFLLAQAKEKAGQLPLQCTPPQWIRGLLQQIPCKDELFSHVICMFSSFGYGETEEDNLAVLKEFSRVIKPGGKILIDLMNRQFIVTHLNKVYHSVQHGLKVKEERMITDNGHRLHNVITVQDTQGEKRMYLYNPWLYNGWDLALLANKADLEVEAIYGDFNGNLYETESQRAMLIARKPR